MSSVHLNYVIRRHTYTHTHMHTHLPTNTDTHAYTLTHIPHTKLVHTHSAKHLEKPSNNCVSLVIAYCLLLLATFFQPANQYTLCFRSIQCDTLQSETPPPYTLPSLQHLADQWEQRTILPLLLISVFVHKFH